MGKEYCVLCTTCGKAVEVLTCVAVFWNSVANLNQRRKKAEVSEVLLPVVMPYVLSFLPRLLSDYVLIDILLQVSTEFLFLSFLACLACFRTVFGF
jgi:hypothetical protein